MHVPTETACPGSGLLWVPGGSQFQAVCPFCGADSRRLVGRRNYPKDGRDVRVVGHPVVPTH